MLLQILDDVLHLQCGLYEQTAQSDSVGTMFFRGSDDDVACLLDSEIDHFVTVVRQNDVDQVLADIVDITLHGGENDRAFLLRAGLLLHLGLEIGDRGFHHPSGVEHGRQLHLARAEQVTDRLHAVQQHGVNQVERRVLRERFI